MDFCLLPHLYLAPQDLNVNTAIVFNCLLMELPNMQQFVIQLSHIRGNSHYKQLKNMVDK